MDYFEKEFCMHLTLSPAVEIEKNQDLIISNENHFSTLMSHREATIEALKRYDGTPPRNSNPSVPEMKKRCWLRSNRNRYSDFWSLPRGLVLRGEPSHKQLPHNQKKIKATFKKTVWDWRKCSSDRVASTGIWPNESVCPALLFFNTANL